MTCEKESVTVGRLAHSFVSVIDVVSSYIEKECVCVNVHACVRERERKMEDEEYDSLAILFNHWLEDLTGNTCLSSTSAVRRGKSQLPKLP